MEQDPKAMPVTGRGSPQGCETSRLPHFLDNQLIDGGDISLTHRPAGLYHQEYFWHSFLSEAESTLGSLLVRLKNPLTSSGIEVATFRLIAYLQSTCFSHLQYQLFAIAIDIHHLKLVMVTYTPFVLLYFRIGYQKSRMWGFELE
jgi:hypothetical protein